MLDTIYNFLFTPIMSKAFMGLFYGVKPVSIAIIFAVVCAFLIVAVIVLNRLDKNTYYNKEFNRTKFNNNDINYNKLSNDTFCDIAYKNIPSNIYYDIYNKED